VSGRGQRSRPVPGSRQAPIDDHDGGPLAIA
jgi:hypothetical protein